MDYYNIDSEIIDPLDYLRPPVKRNRFLCRQRTIGISFNDQPNDVRWPNKITNRETRVESSTSLILKKTSEIEILKKHPTASHTNLTNQYIKAKEKPLIKVTVIPKRGEVQKNSIKKRKHVKRVQSAVSNQENTIKTKNVFLVVAGRRREKVYEIKTTGSAQLSKEYNCCSKNTEISLEQLSNYKEFINSLNMDKMKKKNKKKKQKGDLRIDDDIQDDGDMLHKCPCTGAAINLRSPRSRVTIYGQVGVDEDERYVVNYSATVNKGPVNCTPTRCQMLPFNLGINDEKLKKSANNKNLGCVNECINDIYGCYVCNEYQRDSNIQADFPDDRTYYKLMDKNTTIHNNESQGTQVNFNNNLSNNDTRQFHNKVLCYESCDCDHNNIPDQLSSHFNKNKVNEVKDCQSPLVIISVYPKKDLCDIGKTVICPSGNECKSLLPTAHGGTANSKKNNNTKKNFDSKKNKANISQRPSRSPSPTTKKSSKTKFEASQQYEPRIPRTNIRKQSPDRGFTNTSQKKERNGANKKCDNKLTKLHAHESKQNKKNNYQDTVTPYNIKSQNTQGTNTEHLLAKKAIVDSYTKNIASQLYRNGKTCLKNDVSNVKINIDGDNEDYDVLLYQDNRTTDLKIRKTTKNDMGNQRSCGEHKNDPVMNSLKTNKRGPRKWSLLHGPNDDQSDDDLSSGISRLKLRDSLEIGHRRDDKISKTIKDTQTSENSKVKNLNSNDMKFLAPIKHHAGDKCSVPDPLVRDKEIRELLGIVKSKATTSNTHGAKGRHRNNDRLPMQCFYQEECHNALYDDDIDETKSPYISCDKNAKTNRHSKTPRACGVKDMSTNTQYEPYAIKRTSLCQQMSLTRNIQVFLQVEQFTKPKPIILSRKQYNKVKRTIHDTISKAQERRRSKCICKSSIISVGKIRKKAKPKLQCFDNKATQTDPRDLNSDCCKEQPSTRCIGITTSKLLEAPTSQIFTVGNQNEQHNVSECSEQQVQSLKNVSARRTVSSMEICYASVAYSKRVTFSSTHIKSVSPPNVAPMNSSSIQTIFKGRRKSLTPNLGTSAFSLYSEMGDSKSVKVLMPPRESKPKKPFLRRLMSCLVMRSTRASEVKMALPTPRELSVDSTVDSYHISTSLGAIELSSSIYDTSASFYSNHSILPMSNKMKRGFLSSVRGYLTNRKS